LVGESAWAIWLFNTERSNTTDELGTDKGIARLAEFIEVTDAFAKVPFV